MSSSSPVSALEEISSNGDLSPTTVTNELRENQRQEQDRDVAQIIRGPRIAHIADYAIAINRSLCQSRAPKDRVFQVGGRRRLLYASASAVQRLQQLSRSNEEASWPAKVCGVLADLGVNIADGVFRNQSPETTVRLLTFVIAKLQMHLADATLLELEKKLLEKVGRAANGDIAETLENGFEWRLL